MAKRRDLATRGPAEVITERGIAYSRTATRMKVARAIWHLWDQMRNDEQLDQQWLAERLGKNKGYISKLLNSPGNWTLDTIADLLEAMEGRITVLEVKRYKDIALTSTAIPSLEGLRESPTLWNVVTVLIKSDDNDVVMDSYIDVSVGVPSVVNNIKLIRREIV